MYNLQQIYSALSEQGGLLIAESHPEIYKTGYTKAQLKAFKKRGEKYLNTSAPILSFADFNAYFTKGERNQDDYYEKRGRLLVFSVLAYENKEEKYISALCEAIYALLNEFSWCIPAHLLDTGDVDISPSRYAIHLDLFSCETAFALAEATALCKELLPQSLIEMTHSEIVRRVINPFEKSENHFRFEGMKNNWSAVCGSAIGGAALYIIKDNNRLTNILYRCLSCLDVYVKSFGDDGICTEGVDYWNYGFGFFAAFAELLQTRTNGRLNLFEFQTVETIARAGADFYLGKSATISFSDGSENGAYRMGLMCSLAKRYGFTLPTPSKYAAADTLTDSCYRYCTALRDFCCSDESVGHNVGISGTKWLKSAEWLISHSETGSVLCAKAGNNNESHNHNDCGSFIFLKNGVHLICDLGAGLYDKEYFGEKRYEYLVNRSRSHNVALINGKEQMAGKDYKAREVSPLENGLSCELSGCYNINGLLSYKRKICLCDNEAQLCDSFEFSESGNITEVFCSHTPISLNGGEAIFERNNARAVISFDEKLFFAETTSEKYMTHKDGESTAYFLHLSARERSKTIKFTAKIK